QGCSILRCVSLSALRTLHRDLKEIIAEFLVQKDQASFNMRVVKYPLIIAARAETKKRVH
ncbi:hypothetical protein OU790_19885, partial [Ruegeria sp. NA]|nr:hypothetical protein [Ruegeria sp. NA]